MTSKNTCYNCIHFFRHYIKRGSKLVAVTCGTCLKVKKPKIFSACEIWEKAPTDDINNELIKIRLKEILNRLNDIALLLENS